VFINKKIDSNYLSLFVVLFVMSNSIPSSLKNSNNGSSIEGSNLRRTSWCLSSGNSATTAALLNYHNNLPRNSIEWLSK